MRVRRKNILRVVIVFLVLLEITSIFLMWKSANNKDITLNDVKLKGVNKNSGLAIMIEQEDGTYKESSSNTWPEEMMFNEEKSGCIDNDGNTIDGALTYEGGIANIKTKSSSYCYLYFDIVKNDITIAISTDGVEGTMPTSTKYTNSATCSSGNITWNDKYHRIEIGGLGSTPSECNIAFTKDTSTKTLLRSEVESKYTTNAKGYRYSGTNPNNYIWFNDEMWRIIGSIPTCLTASCGSSERLVKIVRRNSIGTLDFDATNSTNVWGDSSLYGLLNNHYYASSKESLNGQQHPGCSSNTKPSKCDYTENGILSTSYYGKMVKKVFWNTGISPASQTPADAYTNERKTQTTQGYVGLINPSDYGYAVSSNYQGYNLSWYMESAITENNWLYDRGSLYEMVASDYTGSTMVHYVAYAGHSIHTSLTGGLNILPVVYLDSSVYIISGTGTESDPYIIGM